ncbi:MAG TPA: peptide MFS transporter [Gemmatimonadaceae bacterium]|nr:peptide MFS transporter [Gemmatimonadaceae bacterium]
MATEKPVFEQPQSATVTRDEPPPGLERYTQDRSFFGQPGGLSTLFFTEMWERFSYYGIRPLLVLFMTAAVVNGGFDFEPTVASAIVGLYASSVYITALPGGWIADRWLGLQRSIWWGGVLIALGHLSIALSVFMPRSTFFIGLLLIVLGTGLLKPNVSAIVGELYPEGGSRRDAAFSIFYMGINLGAFIAPLITNGLGEKVAWHLGFGVAGLGMVIGLIVFRVRAKRTLGPIGKQPSGDERSQRRVRNISFAILIAFALLVVLAVTGVLSVNPVAIAERMTAVYLALVLLYFGYLFFFAGLTTNEKKRVAVIVVLFVFATVFWSAFEQAPTSLNLFSRDFTDRVIFGWEMPAGWMQSVNSFFVITLAPVFAALWLWLGRRGKDPSSPAKFTIGLAMNGIGFVVMLLAARHAIVGPGQAVRVSMFWLIASYFFQTLGELSLSPVGLSSMTKLAPKRFVGQMMGVWFLASAVGNLIAGLVGGQVDPNDLQQMPELFQRTALSLFIGAVVLGALVIPIRRMMRESPETIQ